MDAVERQATQQTRVVKLEELLYNLQQEQQQQIQELATTVNNLRPPYHHESQGR